MAGSGKRIGGALLAFVGLLLALFGVAAVTINFSIAAIAILVLGVGAIFGGVRMVKTAAAPGAAASVPARSTPGAIFSMQGVQDVLEVFEDTVTIAPIGMLGLMNKGLKGTKTIPFASISATQFREAGPVLSGYLQFSIPGGNESRGGVFAASQDENTFMFAGQKNNELAARIKNHIEGRLRELRRPAPTHQPSTSLSDELQRLAAMRDQGLLSDEEFTSSKRKLLG